MALCKLEMIKTYSPNQKRLAKEKKTTLVTEISFYRFFSFQSVCGQTIELQVGGARGQ